MASQGNLLNERVAKLVSRRYGKPVLKPRQPLALADTVANRRYKVGEATCISEMSILMACWKENAFSDTACAEPVKVFYECIAREQKARKLGAKEEKPAGWMPPQQVNKLLRKFPNINHEV
ncbi:coiled-coil-helix-coiled-coil-helix domain-containing protein 1 [Hyla sarda]|uniref:coiled-coil-helix-coiled-coil-helix domain-containing protein 1 n=1 Tax=Hyla sarda TaxID=327740 RepID=UPI0024C34E0A|nr:coiled-coil-helix-coiled-coil-helix domain-containing protein 1 [Hyla sarda]